MRRYLPRLLPALCLALLAACAQPGGGSGAPAPVPAPVASPAPATSPAPADSPVAEAIAPRAALDTSCKVASDCAVKNVGNCCGFAPACVNKDSPVDPEAVRADCARSGMASVCGWRDIQACDCVQSQCQPRDALVPVER